MSAGHSGGALLLCLDMQPAFLKAVPDSDLLLRRCRLAIAAAGGLGMPAGFTEQVPAKLGVTDPGLRALAPTAPVYAKESFSAFADPTARAQLLGSGTLEHLLLCGIETPICVYQTALQALDADVAVTVLSDAVGARRAEDARTCLAALARAGVHILPVETVFYAMLGGAKHPFFKAYTELVKSHA